MTDESDQEKKNREGSHDASRRRFLKGVGIAGAGAALADSLLVDEAKGAQAGAGQPVSGSLSVALNVNGQRRTVKVEPRTTLLNTLRNNLDPPVTGPKLVCDAGTCGACTVLLNGKPVYSCLVLAIDTQGKEITTVEGLGSPEALNAVQTAFIDKDALMCGFCTPGFITTISSYIQQHPSATAPELRDACKGNFCRCGTYPRIFEAALAAVQATANTD
ncbi:MAG TPA: (2Fe-2S)-binding protein [Pyrinomonadaceae bacterium]|nr:(2Fe-2S)-binding protein [Pyrinomonadaceae bacterium]